MDTAKVLDLAPRLGLLVEHGRRGAAVFSPDRRHRYLLTRPVPDADPAAPHLTIIMLNPSKADATINDPTITRCTALAKRQAAGGITVVNLFALCATKPRDLVSDPDPVGVHNDTVLDACTGHRRPVLVAWGNNGRLNSRGTTVAQRLHRAGVPMLCLGTNIDGTPRHPVRLHNDTPLVPYAPPSVNGAQAQTPFDTAGHQGGRGDRG